LLKETTESPASILVVDDDPDICQNLSDILTDLGYRVDVASHGFGALELIRQKPYDVVLLDYKMPGMDGLTLYREIRKLRADTVAVMVTAYAEGDTAEAALAAGAWKVLAKPVDLPRLLGLVDAALEQPLVMVVDDDHALCDSLWDVLRERGYRVCVAHNELEAAGHLAERNYKAVLIDMNLSQHRGGERVYEMVRQCQPTPRTILITGFRSEMAQAINQLLAEGVEAVSYKPFDLPQLLSTLERLAK
jgi:CheY-like chemotaxis protein